MLGDLLDNRYRVLRTLSKGGFGQTYIAQDTRRPGHPECVLKHLEPIDLDPFHLKNAQRLFEKEAAALERLGRNHPQIPRLLAYFEEDNNFYLVQDLIRGHPLTHELKRRAKWSDPAIYQLLHDVLSILVFVHDRGVIHRDIKPDNLIRRKLDRTLVLVDFGSVKQIHPHIPPSDETGHTIAIGTMGYMATEQARGKPRPSSDLYSLGIIGIQAATGIKPKHLKEDFETGELVWQDKADVCDELAQFLTKMVAYHFKDRYVDAREALQELQTLSIADTVEPSITVIDTKFDPAMFNAFPDASSVESGHAALYDTSGHPDGLTRPLHPLSDPANAANIARFGLHPISSTPDDATDADVLQPTQIERPEPSEILDSSYEPAEPSISYGQDEAQDPPLNDTTVTLEMAHHQDAPSAPIVEVVPADPADTIPAAISNPDWVGSSHQELSAPLPEAETFDPPKLKDNPATADRSRPPVANPQESAATGTLDGAARGSNAMVHPPSSPHETAALIHQSHHVDGHSQATYALVPVENTIESIVLASESAPESAVPAYRGPLHSIVGELVDEVQGRWSAIVRRMPAPPTRFWVPDVRWSSSQWQFSSIYSKTLLLGTVGILATMGLGTWSYRNMQEHSRLRAAIKMIDDKHQRAQYEECRTRAQSVLALYTQAHDTAVTWLGKCTLQQAEELAIAGNLMEAIALAQTIPAEADEYHNQAAASIDDWFQKSLEQAEQHYQDGNIKPAIATALDLKTNLPVNHPLQTEVQLTLLKWNEEEEIWLDAQTLLDSNLWDDAIQRTKPIAQQPPFVNRVEGLVSEAEANLEIERTQEAGPQAPETEPQ